MKRLLFTMTGLCLLLATQEASAQCAPGYVNRPVISPYVNLFQSNNGGLNSYFSFVRPRQEMDNFMRQTARQEQLQRSMIRQESIQLQRSIEQAVDEGTLSVRPSNNMRSMRPAGTFMQYSPYFPNSSVSGGRRR